MKVSFMKPGTLFINDEAMMHEYKYIMYLCRTWIGFGKDDEFVYLACDGTIYASSYDYSTISYFSEVLEP